MQVMHFALVSSAFAYGLTRAYGCGSLLKSINNLCLLGDDMCFVVLKPKISKDEKVKKCEYKVICFGLI